MTAAAVAGLLAVAATVSARAGCRARAGRRVAARLPSRTTCAPVGFGFAAPPVLGRALDAAGVATDPVTVLASWLGAAVLAACVALLAGGLGFALLAFTIAAIAPLLWLRAWRARGAARLQAELPAVLDAIARSLRSGAATHQAIGEAADAAVSPLLRADLAAIVADAEHDGIVRALERWRLRRPLPGVRLVVAALALGVETGGAQARAIDGIAATMRQRLAVADEVRALSSQARSSAMVIAVAPLGFSAVALSADPRLADVLLRTPLGLTLLGSGLALDAAGALWMARITRGSA